jgi:LEA14-like dessication related protein
MNKVILAIVIIIIISISFLSYIFLNYRSDVEAINNLNLDLKDVDIFEINILTSFKLKLTVEITNPSNREINDLSSNFEIFIEDQYIGQGNFSNVNINKNSKINQDISITIYYSGLAEAIVEIIKNLIDEGDFTLKIDGTLYAKTLFGMSTIKQHYFAIKSYP